MSKTNEYGLLIEHIEKHGGRQVNAVIVRRESDKDYPLGCSSDGERFFSDGAPKHLLDLQLDGLGMYGYISDRPDYHFFGGNIEYRDVFSVDMPKVRRMEKALKRIFRQVDKDKAYEPGDLFLSLATALKLAFVVERLRPEVTARTGEKWRWTTVAEGRNRYRQLIEEASRAERERREPARAAS